MYHTDFAGFRCLSVYIKALYTYIDPKHLNTTYKSKKTHDDTGPCDVMQLLDINNDYFAVNKTVIP